MGGGGGGLWWSREIERSRKWLNRWGGRARMKVVTSDGA